MSRSEEIPFELSPTIGVPLTVRVLWVGNVTLNGLSSSSSDDSSVSSANGSRMKKPVCGRGVPMGADLFELSSWVTTVDYNQLSMNIHTNYSDQKKWFIPFFLLSGSFLWDIFETNKPQNKGRGKCQHDSCTYKEQKRMSHTGNSLFMMGCFSFRRAFYLPSKRMIQIFPSCMYGRLLFR